MSTNIINLLANDTDLSSHKTELAPLESRLAVQRTIGSQSWILYFQLLSLLLFFFQSLLFPVVLLKLLLSFQLLDFGYHSVFESIVSFLNPITICASTAARQQKVKYWANVSISPRRRFKSAGVRMYRPSCEREDSSVGVRLSGDFVSLTKFISVPVRHTPDIRAPFA